jgi:single-stranded DNA-binding protein
MSISANVSCCLVSAPEKRVTKSGNPFVTAKAKVSTGDGLRMWVDLAVFDSRVASELAVLPVGAALAVAGDLYQTSWTSKDGDARSSWKMTVFGILNAAELSTSAKATRFNKSGGSANYARSIAAARPSADDSRSVARLWRDEVSRAAD